MLHTVQLPSDLVRVCVNKVAADYEDLDPPMQPNGADSHMKLGNYKNWTIK